MGTKNLLFSLLAAAVGMAAPGAAWAAEYTVSSESDLATKISSAQSGDVIKLGADINMGTNEVSISKAITLDLNGHKLSGSGSYDVVYVSGDGVNVTITDSASGGSIENTSSASASGNNYYAAVYVDRGAQLEIGAVTVKSNNYGIMLSWSSLGNTNTTKVTLNGTTVNANVGVNVTGKSNSKVALDVNDGTSIAGTTYGIAGNGLSGYGETAITINGGSVTGTDAGIYHPQAGTLTLNGGTISGGVGVQMCAGTLSIPSSSTVSVKGTGSDGRDSKTGDGAIDDGAAISLVNRNYPGGAPTATIEAGTFTSSTEAVATYSWSSNAASEWTDAGSSVNVSGGSFSTPVADDLLASGLANTSSDGSTFTPGSKDGMVEVHISENISNSKQATVYFSTHEAADTFVDSGNYNLSSPVYLLKPTVTYKLNNGAADQTEIVAAGEAAKGIATPTLTGYTFTGWYTDKAATTKYDFSQSVTGDLTLYAGWTKTAYTVTFVINGSQETAQIEHGNKVSRPTAPTLDGYTFVGWYADASFTTPYDFSQAVTGNTTIYACYMPDATVKAYRKVKISAADGVTTDPGAGTYYVAGGQNFTFTASFADGAVQKVFAKGYYSEKSVELEAKQIDRYTYQYTLHKVTEPMTITFGTAANAGETGTEAVAETKVWAHGNTLYISAANETEAAVYSITGAVIKTLRLPAGEVAETLNRGVYVVKAGGKTAKVVIK